MASFGKTFNKEEVTKRPSEQGATEKLSQREELLMKNKDFLEKMIHQELLYIQKNSRTNTTVALQALRRKKWYEENLRENERLLKSLRDNHQNMNLFNKLIGLMKVDKERNPGMPDFHYMWLEEKFDEDELLAELQRLENSLDGSGCEKDTAEEGTPGPKKSSTASPSDPAKTEENEVEEQLESLRRWVNS